LHKKGCFFIILVMRYLMYEKGGSIKKFPLTQTQIIIGRGAACDIRLADPDISKKHCRIGVYPDHIHIDDLKSRNGTFVDKKRISEARIMLNTSFGVGNTDFFYKEGDIGEFNISKELSGIFAAISNSRLAHQAKESDTRDSQKKYAVFLQCLLEKALWCDGFSSFIGEIGELLACNFPAGSLFLVHHNQTMALFNHCALALPEIQADFNKGSYATGSVVTIHGSTYANLVVPSRDTRDCLLWISAEKANGKENTPFLDFLNKLLEIIEFNQKIITGISFDPFPPPMLFNEGGICIIGTSPAMRKIIDTTTRIADKSTFILLMGESGTGKELIARMIHHLSKRKTYVAINCAAIPGNLLESELFGYEAGAFTDARKRKIGKIEAASGGTLVLDEIGDLPLETQAKLLRVIQERSLTRLGGSEEIPVDLRIIAITNRDLYTLVETGRFRQDLFFRLRVHELVIPPLRERSDDIVALIIYFARIYAAKNNLSPRGFSETARECLIHYHWPGNIRELENEIMRIMEIIDDGELIGNHHITASIVAQCKQDKTAETDMAELSFKSAVDKFERQRVLQLLGKYNGSKAKTAQAMGITYQGLVKKMKRLGIE
jgi:transcriptional regulator with AAA-type ATPase domain